MNTFLSEKIKSGCTCLWKIRWYLFKAEPKIKQKLNLKCFSFHGLLHSSSCKFTKYNFKVKSSSRCFPRRSSSRSCSWRAGVWSNTIGHLKIRPILVDECLPRVLPVAKWKASQKPRVGQVEMPIKPANRKNSHLSWSFPCPRGVLPYWTDRIE